VSFSGDGVAGPEKIVGGYYRGCPAPGESEWAPHFPPDEDGVLAVCTRVIGWLLQVNSQVTCQSSAIQLRLPLRYSHYGLLDRPAIPCGWSGSQPSRASQHPRAAHQAGLTRQHLGNRSNYLQTQYRVDQACLRGRLLFPSHRSVARQIACLLRRVYLGLRI
jgi:hypothetical protein